MTVGDALAQAGVTVNTPIQSTANNPAVPAPVAAVASFTGTSIQYACGPTSAAVLVLLGINPELA